MHGKNSSSVDSAFATVQDAILCHALTTEKKHCTSVIPREQRHKSYVMTAALHAIYEDVHQNYFMLSKRCRVSKSTAPVISSHYGKY